MTETYVVGTFDTKGEELAYLVELLRKAGVEARRVDLSTTPGDRSVEVSAAEVARHGDEEACFSADRGQAIGAMSRAFEAWVRSQGDGIAGLISCGGSGGTALVAPGFRALAVGVPKLLVSTVASGDVAPYVGPSDMTMMYSVTDVAGLNPISRRVLGNAAHALAGMVRGASSIEVPASRPAIGMTMFGVTTACVTQCREALAADYECLVFHATGTGGRSMEKLCESGMLAGMLDVTLTEVCDLIAGGIMSAGEGRLDVVAATGVPWVGSVGALDMVNFGGRATVPERYSDRLLHEHNPEITLMRTTPEENRAMGEWIARKLNGCEGPVRLLLPEGGVSAMDAPGQPFHDPVANAALFAAIEATLEDSSRLIRLPHHINDPAFAEALTAHLLEVL